MSWLGSAVPALRQTLRRLWRAPLTTSAVVLALALGLAANGVIFSVVDAVLLRALPFEAPEHLVLLQQTNREQQGEALSYPSYQDWVRLHRSFESLAAFKFQTLTLRGTETPLQVPAAVVSGNYFQTLRTPARQGRWLLPEDDVAAAPAVVVLSDRMWRDRLGAAEDVLGRQLHLDGRVFQVVGVMPRGFRSPLAPEAELWVTFGPWRQESFVTDRGSRPGIYALGRLRADAFLASARQDMEGVARRLAEEYPATEAGRGVEVRSLTDSLFGTVRPTLRALVWLGAAILLVALINLSVLLIARTNARRGELALRMALGARRGRLAARFLGEVAVYCGLAVVLAWLLANWGLRLLRPWLPESLPRVDTVSLDGRTAVFLLLAAVVCCLVLTSVSILAVRRQRLRDALQEAGTSRLPGRWAQRVQRLLVSVQIATVMVMLVGTSLLISSVRNLLAVDPGFDAGGVVTARLDLPPEATVSSEARSLFIDRLRQRLEALVPAGRAAIAQPVPMTGALWTTGFVLRDRPPPEPEMRPRAAITRVSPGYFETLDISLLQGRSFGAQDDALGEPVAIVDQAFAERFWPGGEAVGEVVKLNYNPQAPHPWRRIVGVTASVRTTDLLTDTGLQLYVPFDQKPVDSVSLVLRGGSADSPEDSAATELMQPLRLAMVELAPAQPLYDLRPLAGYLAEATALHRLALLLLALVTGLALTLAVIGIFAIVAYTVTRRQSEIGLRMALGATPVTARWLVLREVGGWLLAGTLAGLGLSFALLPTLDHLMVRVETRNFTAFATAALVVVLSALLACAGPLRRAGRLDPAALLRQEQTAS